METSTTMERDIVVPSYFLNFSVAHGSKKVFMSSEVEVICQWIIYAVACQGVDIFGIGTNIINIIIFIKQGFKDAINVSLIGLAISDLCCLISLVMPNICLAPAFSTLDLPFDPIELPYLTGGWPHVTFTRITAWITAVITLERCLCITVPLKVKRVVTPTRVTILLICLYTVLIFSIAPVYVVNRLEMKFSHYRNRTLIGLVFTEDREQVEQISYIINNALIPFCAFFIIIICTVVLVIKLRQNTKWREHSMTSAQADNTFIRNQKVAKMVVMISSIFIACFIPISIAFMAMTLVPELSVYGSYRSLLTILAGLCLVLESINSSVNIFIYYHMSSKYRTSFHELFCRTYITNSTYM